MINKKQYMHIFIFVSIYLSMYTNGISVYKGKYGKIFKKKIWTHKYVWIFYFNNTWPCAKNYLNKKTH